MSATATLVKPSAPAPTMPASLPKGLGEDYGQLRMDEIDGYLGNPG